MIERREKKAGDYLVLCREDVLPTGEPGNYVLPSQAKTFATFQEAVTYATALSHSRQPIVVRVIGLITGQEVTR